MVLGVVGVSAAWARARVRRAVTIWSFILVSVAVSSAVRYPWYGWLVVRKIVGVHGGVGE